MNQAIELHDSELSSIASTPGVVELAFDRAYVHRSLGLPGTDAGSGWLQGALFKIFDGVIESALSLPGIISEGVLLIGDNRFENIIPAEGSFEGLIDFAITLSTGQKIKVRGNRLIISLHGIPTYIEDFKH